MTLWTSSGHSVKRAMSDRKRRNMINALQRIRFIAAMHYMGGAFDPEHMRDLANIAADALAGKDFAPMRDVEKIKKESQYFADLYAGWVSDDSEYVHEVCDCNHAWADHEDNPTTPDWKHCTLCKRSCMVD